MGVESFLKYFQDIWRVIADAPLVALLLALLGAFMARLYYSGQLAAMTGQLAAINERMKFKDEQIAEFKEKLKSGSPDEAKARMERLEATISGLSPRRLTSAQRAGLGRSIVDRTGQSNYRIDVIHEMSCPDCNTYAAELANVFQATAGWQVRNPSVLGPTNRPRTGLGLIVRNTAQLTAPERVLMNALGDAEIRFDALQQQPQIDPHTGASAYDVALIVTAKGV